MDLRENLELRCAKCDFAFQVPPGAGGRARFCPACGSSLSPAAAPAGSTPRFAPVFFGDEPGGAAASAAVNSANALRETADFGGLAAGVRDRALSTDPAETRLAANVQIPGATPPSDVRVTDSDAGARLPPGLEIAGCRVLRFLGRGGMGQVYEVEWLGALEAPDASRTQALKILLPEVSRSRPYVEQFVQEAQIAVKLNHPNIVRTYDAGFKDGVLCLRMELIRGGTLRERLKPNTRFSPRFAARVVRQIGEGLAHAHAVGVLHRDVKPENILIDTSGTEPCFKLSDFGLIKQLGDVVPDPVLSQSEFQKVCDIITKQLNQMQESPGQAAPASNLVAGLLHAIDQRALQDFQFVPAVDPATAYQELEKIKGEATISLGMHHSECLGTPAYMSPEQIEGRRTDGRSDIYALGAVYYELLSGRPPYQGATAREVIAKKLTQPAPSLRDFYSPADWLDAQRYARIIEFMLQKDKRCRYRSMRFCVDDILRALSGEEPWCSNSRSLYADAERSYGLETVDQRFPTDRETSMLLNLMQAVFEMV